MPTIGIKNRKGKIEKGNGNTGTIEIKYRNEDVDVYL